MLKRIIPIILCFVLLFSISVMAENDNAVTPDDAPSESQQAQEDEKNLEGFEKDGNMPQFPDGNGFPGMQAANAEPAESDPGFLETYATPITSVFLLILAFVFVVFYRRKHF